MELGQGVLWFLGWQGVGEVQGILEESGGWLWEVLLLAQREYLIRVAGGVVQVECLQIATESQYLKTRFHIMIMDVPCLFW